MEEEKMFKKVSQLKPGNYILIEENACRIKNIEKSKPGRHGAAKARISAVGVFDNQKRNMLKPTSANAEIPVMKKATAQVVAIMGDIVQIMDKENYQTFDVKKPSFNIESGKEIEYMQYGSNVLISKEK